MWEELTLSSRRKRSLEEEYHEWISWMTDEQKQELQHLRDSQASFQDIHKKVNEHFNKLSEAKQKQLINEYKVLYIYFKKFLLWLLSITFLINPFYNWVRIAAEGGTKWMRPLLFCPFCGWVRIKTQNLSPKHVVKIRLSVRVIWWL